VGTKWLIGIGIDSWKLIKWSSFIYPPGLIHDATLHSTFQIQIMSPSYSLCLIHEVAYPCLPELWCHDSYICWPIDDVSTHVLIDRFMISPLHITLTESGYYSSYLRVRIKLLSSYSSFPDLWCHSISLEWIHDITIHNHLLTHDVPHPYRHLPIYYATNDRFMVLAKTYLLNYSWCHRITP